jgi:hypothetical protein
MAVYTGFDYLVSVAMRDAAEKERNHRRRDDAPAREEGRREQRSKRNK